MALDKYERFQHYHIIDIKAIEQSANQQKSLGSLTDVNSAGATAGQVLVKLPDGTYGFSTITGTGYTKVETDLLLDTKLDDSQLGANNGVASLDSTGKLIAAQLPTHNHDTQYYTRGQIDSQMANKAGLAHSHTVSEVTNLQTLLDAKLDGTKVGASGGAASLDAGGKIPFGQMPTGTTGTSVALGNHTHSQYQDASQKGAANGYPSLDAGTKIPFAQVPTGTTGTTVAIGNHTHSQYQDSAQRGVANGYAPLDASNLIPLTHIPVGTTSTTVASGDHTHSQYPTLDGSNKLSYSVLPVGTAASTIAAGDDARFTNARTPLAHAASHAFNAADPVVGLVPAVAARPSTGLYNGYTIYRTDKSIYETYDGTVWRVRGVVSVTTLSDITNPFTDQLAILSGQLYRYDGASWENAKPFLHAYQTAAQTLTTGTYNAITMTGEFYDNVGGHSTATNPSRYTPPVAGWYRCTGQVVYSANSAGSRSGHFRKNGATVDSAPYFGMQAAATTDTAACIIVTGLIQCNGTTDYIELYAYQSSGANLTTLSATGYTNSFMQIEYVGA